MGGKPFGKSIPGPPKNNPRANQVAHLGRIKKNLSRSHTCLGAPLNTPEVNVKASNLIRQLLTDLIQPLVMPIEYVNNRGLSIGSVEDFEPAFLL